MRRQLAPGVWPLVENPMAASDTFFLGDYDFPDYSGRDVPERPQRVLYIRLDGIGDAVLSGPLPGAIRALYPDAELVAVCDVLCEDLFRRNPHVDRVLAFDKYRLGRKDYFGRAVKIVAALRADLAFNLVGSNNFTGFALSFLSGAPVILGANDCACIDARGRDFFASRALRVLRPADKQPPDTPHSAPHNTREAAPLPETQRYRALFALLGGDASAYGPRLWLGDDDYAAAAAVWRESGLAPERTLALFASGGFAVRDYLHFGEALAPLCRERGLSILALGGGERETLINEYCVAVLQDEGVPALNYCGKLSVTASAAALAGCRLAVGTETGLAHMACALGVPQAVLLGGGHFGRFMPYSPLTTAISLPLECYGCDWLCRYPEAVCVKELSPSFLGKAVEVALDRPGGGRFGRVLLQTPSAWRPQKGGPAWKSPQEFISRCKAVGGEDALEVRIIR